jgi:hypothetical protein
VDNQVPGSEKAVLPGSGERFAARFRPGPEAEVVTTLRRYQAPNLILKGKCHGTHYNVIVQQSNSPTGEYQKKSSPVLGKGYNIRLYRFNGFIDTLFL